MKKYLLLSSLFLFLFSSGASAADKYFIKPGILPDSAVYWVDRWSEEVRFFFTFGKISKADYRVHQAEERLAELKVLYEKGVRDKTEKLLTDYRDEITDAQKLYDQVKVTTIEKARELQDETETTIITHETGVKEYLLSLPEQLNASTESTIAVTSNGFDLLLEHLKQKREQIEQKKNNLGVND